MMPRSLVSRLQGTLMRLYCADRHSAVTRVYSPYTLPRTLVFPALQSPPHRAFRTRLTPRRPAPSTAPLRTFRRMQSSQKLHIQCILMLPTQRPAVYILLSTTIIFMSHKRISPIIVQYNIFFFFFYIFQLTAGGVVLSS